MERIILAGRTMPDIMIDKLPPYSERQCHIIFINLSFGPDSSHSITDIPWTR